MNRLTDVQMHVLRNVGDLRHTSPGAKTYCIRWCCRIASRTVNTLTGEGLIERTGETNPATGPHFRLTDKGKEAL